jgi:hypothetical protein
MKDTLLDRLSRFREIHISVTGRKSGKTITVPVWFALDGTTLDLLPVQGSDTQWFKNVLKHPQIHVSARGTEGDFRVTAVRDTKAVAAVVDRFREKYGAGDVKKYYSKFDVAVTAKVA